MNLTFIRHLFVKNKKRGSILFKKDEHIKLKVNKPDLTIRIKFCPIHKEACMVAGIVAVNSFIFIFRNIVNCPDCKVEYV